MPTPFKQQVQSQIWALLETHAPVSSAFLVGNRLKRDQTGSLKEKIHRAPNDFPQLDISNGRFTHSGFGLPDGMTYGMQNATTAAQIADWIVQRRAEYKITITGRTDKDDIDAAEEAIQDALLLGGPRLGLSFVAKWGPLAAEQKISTVQTALRIQSIITIPVVMEFSGAALLASIPTP